MSIFNNMELTIVQNYIREARGCRVMLDTDLAALYGVETRVLNQAVKRNLDLFPSDFMFRLTETEWEYMSSQVVMTSGEEVKKRPKSALPYVFTEHGVTMLANVLKSPTARQMSSAIVRVFIKMREMLLEHKELGNQLLDMEARYNRQFEDIYEAIQYLLEKDKIIEEQQQRTPIGFR